MGTHTGIVVKMPVRLEDGVARYTLRLEHPGQRTRDSSDPQSQLDPATLTGHGIRIEHTGEYVCVRCGRSVKKLFGEGFCFPCFRDAPEASECIVKPELCMAHLDGDWGRDPQWEQDHHNQPHVVYLALTSALKVGVTRGTQVPVRWIDQGAASAVVIAHVPYRHLAGRIEVALKALYTDRTAWQRMLKDEQPPEPVDLAVEMDRIRDHLGTSEPELVQYLVPGARLEPTRIAYPVEEVPNKVKAVSLARTPVLESILRGIRGQYLIFEGGSVLNVRRHSGFVVRVTGPGVVSHPRW